MDWYSAKLIFKHNATRGEIRAFLEERIIVVKVESNENPEKKIETFAEKYVEQTGNCKFIKLIDTYQLDCEDEIGDGQEIYSLMHSTTATASQFIKIRYPDNKLKDCKVENLDHCWYKIDESTNGCYHCRKTQRI